MELPKCNFKENLAFVGSEQELRSGGWWDARGVAFPLPPFPGKETEREKTPQHMYSKYFIK